MTTTSSTADHVPDLMPCAQCGLPHTLRGSLTIPSCSGHRKQHRGGGPCGNPKVNGQEVCRMHGGASPQALQGAERRELERQIMLDAETFGLPVEDMDAHTALLQELQRTAGAVAWLGAVVADLDSEAVVWGVTRSKTDGVDRGTTTEAAVNMWVKLWQAERTHYVAVAAACARAGIDERRTLIVESQARALAGVVQRILNGVYEALVGQLGSHDAARVVLESAWPDMVSTIVPNELRAMATQGGV